MDEFKTLFKYFKRKNPKPDLSRVIDFDKNLNLSLVRDVPVRTVEKVCKECEDLGLNCHTQWKAYTLSNKNGFIVIKNPFSVIGQRRWIRNSLQAYITKPSVTNLDAHYNELNDIWKLQWSEEREKREYLAKLRWATFGYHYNWDSKQYSLDHKCNFPPCLLSLSKHVALCLGYENYFPEAAIVNFYHMGSHLGRHVDDSEKDHFKPIISFSFGQSAVFLLGSKIDSDEPSAMYLRSGDIVVMGGESRLFYHAVPLIIRDNPIGRFENQESCSSDWEPFSKYIENSRININVRQVLLSSENLRMENSQ